MSPLYGKGSREGAQEGATRALLRVKTAESLNSFSGNGEAERCRRNGHRERPQGEEGTSPCRKAARWAHAPALDILCSPMITRLNVSVDDPALQPSVGDKTRKDRNSAAKAQDYGCRRYVSNTISSGKKNEAGVSRPSA
ncbi:hypothetical protein NDU88_000590 [Pleurodeles waltl]|uniref:Uncharacterized protein n=1 Tax=Pleurodeles waltl TaxID=8319 RepID=A0AAV7NCM4_PLEWA|nr:hypothetical protein NDU88_000590 [Pleurodeles waltl]